MPRRISQREQFRTAIIQNNIPEARRLALRPEIDINDKLKGGDYPLTLAVAYGHFEIADHLLELGAYPDLAIKQLAEELAQDPDYVDELNLLLLDAIYSKDTIRYVNGVDPNKLKHRHKIVAILLDAGADPYTVDEQDQLAVFIAALKGDMAVVNEFLVRNVKPWELGQYLIVRKLAMFVRNGNEWITFNGFKLRVFKKNYGDSLAIAESLERSPWFCFSFAICHALMDIELNKLAWWEAALKLVARWDNTIDNLDEKVVLPQEETSSTRRDIFFRVLNYLVFHRAQKYIDQTVGEFNDSAVTQENLLRHVNVNVSRRIKFLENHSFVAGHFSISDLDLLLDQSKIKNAICEIGNDWHSLRVGYKNDQWLLYEANYSHVGEGNIYQEFSDKDELLDEIIFKIGHAVSIQMASYDSKADLSFPHYEQIPLNELLAQNGLNIIYINFPSLLPLIVDRVQRSGNGHAVLVDALSSPWDKRATVLHVLMRENFPILSDFFNLLTQTQKGKEVAVSLLCTFDENGFTCLRLMQDDAIFSQMISRLFSAKNFLSDMVTNLFFLHADGESECEKFQQYNFVIYEILIDSLRQKILALNAKELRVFCQKLMDILPNINSQQTLILSEELKAAALKRSQLLKVKTLISSSNIFLENQKQYESLTDVMSVSTEDTIARSDSFRRNSI